MIAWLRAPGWWGVPRYRWVLCVLAVAVLLALRAWHLSPFGLLALLRPARVTPRADTPDPGPAALDAHAAARATDEALEAVAAESRDRAAVGQARAAGDDIATVRARVEARARKACEERGVEYLPPGDPRRPRDGR